MLAEEAGATAARQHPSLLVMLGGGSATQQGVQGMLQLPCTTCCVARLTWLSNAQHPRNERMLA
eukprot:8341115-Pyramimonas_sp.AAC.1